MSSIRISHSILHCKFMNLLYNELKGCINISSFQSRSLYKCQAMLISILCSFFFFNFPLLYKVSFIAHQHDYYSLIGIFLQLLEPFMSIIKANLRCNIINEEGTNCSPIVSICNRSISLLPCSVPDLRLNQLIVCRRYRLSSKLDSNRRLRF